MPLLTPATPLPSLAFVSPMPCSFSVCLPFCGMRSMHRLPPAPPLLLALFFVFVSPTTGGKSLLRFLTLSISFDSHKPPSPTAPKLSTQGLLPTSLQFDTLGSLWIAGSMTMGSKAGELDLRVMIPQAGDGGAASPSPRPLNAPP